MIVEHVSEEITQRTKDQHTCARIVSDILYQIHETKGAEEDIVLLFTNGDLLRTVIQNVIKMDRKYNLVVS